MIFMCPIKSEVSETYDVVFVTNMIEINVLSASNICFIYLSLHVKKVILIDT